MAGSSDIFAALKTAWTAAGATLSGINGPYFDRKPSGTAVGLPYAIFRSLANVPRGWTCANEIWQHNFSFIVRNTTAELAEANLNAIGSYFDPLMLSLAVGASIRLRRTGESYREEDKNIFVAEIEYELWRYKPRS